MTKQEIITKCIEAYTEAIEVCGKLDFNTAQIWLTKKTLDNGVCFFTRWVLGEYVYGEEWILRNQNGLRWANYPYKCQTHEKLIQSLQTRLDILKKELSIPE